MKIAILSGKGGTGKTTLSVNLFSILENATLIDTDTEEPNSHLFLHGTKSNETHVYKNHPIIDYDKCNYCGKCGDYCNFNAIIPTKNKVIVFEDFCHDCGFCEIVCDSEAISYKSKSIGTINTYTLENKQYLNGILNVGEVSGVRIIDNLKKLTSKEETLIIDAPPGVSCSTVAAINGVDYAIVVAEPTPFGVSDMKMVVELLQEEGILFGVVVNKSGLGNDEIYSYLEEVNVPVLGNIPFTKKRAEIYSRGDLIHKFDREFKNTLLDIYVKVAEVCND